MFLIRPNVLLLAAPAAILILALICMAAIAWARRIRQLAPPLQISADELALVQQAANGETAAAEELARRVNAEVAMLRRKAETDRQAALRYRDEVRQRLRALEPLHGQLATMNFEESKQKAVAQRIAQQQTEALRELAWVEAQLERRGR